MLSDGDYLDNHLPLRFEEDDRRARLVQQFGVRAVDDDTFERLCSPDAENVPLRALINIGVPSGRAWSVMLDVAFAQLHLPLLNAPGTSVLGNKAMLPFVNDMIEFYCERAPLLQTPPTTLLRDGTLPPDPEKWVVKSAAGCQGSGVSILCAQTPAQLESIRNRLIGSWPADATVAQRHVALSQLWTVGPRGDQTYRVELRALAYVLGWQNVFAGGQALGKLAPSDRPDSLNNVAKGGSYVPIIRQLTEA
jgi:uncharacterized circularly permuted ATP-grasp superfamily protein